MNTHDQPPPVADTAIPLGVREAYRRQPWVPRVPISPNNVAWLDNALQTLADTRAIASGALDDDDDIATELEFGLERGLDGVSVPVERTGSGREKRPR